MPGLGIALWNNNVAAIGGGGGGLPTIALTTATGAARSAQITVNGTGNLTASVTGSHGAVRADHAASTSKFQVEALYVSGSAATISIEDGTLNLGSTDFVPGREVTGGVSGFGSGNGNTEFTIYKDTAVVTSPAYAYATGDRVGAIVDTVAHTVQFYTVHSGVVTLEGSAVSWTSGSGSYYVSLGWIGSSTGSTTLVPGSGQTRALDSGFTYFGA